MSSPIWNLVATGVGGGLTLLGGYLAETRRRKAELAKDMRERHIALLWDLQEAGVDLRHFLLAFGRDRLGLGGPDVDGLMERTAGALLRAKVLSSRIGSQTLKDQIEHLRTAVNLIEEDAKLLPDDPTHRERQAVWFREGGAQEEIEERSLALQDAIEEQLRAVEQG